jgi:hypothetical protein
MKKILLSAAVMALGFAAQAQSEIKFGAKAGLNLATYGADANDVDGIGSRTSFHVGAVAEFKFTEKFSVQPELLYSMQGAKADILFSDGFDTYSIKATDKLDYLILPVMAKYYVIKGLSIEAGPQVGFLLSAKSKAESGDDSMETNVKDDYKSLDFSINGGVGYQLPMGLFLQARYNIGMANILKTDDETGDAKITNNVLQFSVGYKF